MAIQLATTVRNARLSAIETIINGTAANCFLCIFESTGTPPANPAAANNGTVLVTIDLTGDAFQNPSSGAMQKTASAWQDASADATGTADYFRIFDGDTPTTCLVQGTVGQGTGDLQLDNTSIASGQQVTITTFTLTDGNA